MNIQMKCTHEKICNFPLFFFFFVHLLNMAGTYDYLFKFIIIGDAATGKSCILHRFIEEKCEFI